MAEITFSDWSTAGELARSLGVNEATIRRRAARREIETMPNPDGPGRLYRETPGPMHGCATEIEARAKALIPTLEAELEEVVAEVSQKSKRRQHLLWVVRGLRGMAESEPQAADS